MASEAGGSAAAGQDPRNVGTELRTSASVESDPPAAPARRVTGKHTHVRARCKLVRIRRHFVW